jgi:hypothetical protein
LGLALVVSCARVGPSDKDPGLFLLSPATAGFVGRLIEDTALTTDGHTVNATVLVEVTPQVVKLAVLSPLGARLLSLQWDGTHLAKSVDPSLPKDFPAELVLRDFQLARWPAEVVRHALPKSWTLQELPDARVLSHDGKERIHIGFTRDREAEAVAFEHRGLGYRVDLHVRQEPL